MAHHEQHGTPVGDSVFAIVAAFTSGLDVFKRLRERRRRRKSSKKSHRSTPAQLEPSGDELQLSNSLRQNPVDIQRHYETNYTAVGERFAQGDAIAHASLTEVLLKLNSGLVSIIGAFLAPSKSDHHPDYKSLTSLSDSSRAEAIDALGQLYHRLSQSQLVLDRIRHKCPSCGSHNHYDCASSSTNLKQRGGCANTKRLPGAKPRPRRSQTELVIVRRPRNSAKYPPLRTSTSTALRAQKPSHNSSSSSSTTVTASHPPTDLAFAPQLPSRTHSTSTSRSDPPPSYSKAIATSSRPPSREQSVTRKPVRTATGPPTPAKYEKPTAASTPTTPILQRPEASLHGPRPLLEATTAILPIIPPPKNHQQPYHEQPRPLPATPQRLVHHHQQITSTSTAAAASAALIPAPLYHQPALPARPPKFPVSTASLAELPAPPPPANSTPNVLQRRQPPAPPPKKQHLQAPRHQQQQQQQQQRQQQPLPGRHSRNSPSSSSVHLTTHPSAQLSRRGTVPPAAASTYSFASDSTKLGEIPMRNWAIPWDFAAMERANAEAAAAVGMGAGTGEEGGGGGGGGGRRRGLLRFLRRGD